MRFDHKQIYLKLPDGRRINSSRKKLGAIVCDNAQLGVNAAIMPGTIVESGSTVMPGEIVKGIVRAK